ncbi:nucleotidyltransferase family protein [Atribacter laminatus]|uniref:Nucleotidyltransferase domain-containing protein n=1 Tax=Atribacter laminatus TaxID=2847778 RepID=A0A7T1AJF3_ATRLM|nr:nucleotidyltransferase domain-containing protein [Atribacter laminatus]QPM67041.1 hypothetical protein RT761_00229 [Atribacter laminatus]
MTKTAKDLTQEELKKFKESYRQRIIQQDLNLKKRFDEAWRVAQEAAQVLYKNYQATKVQVFGSLLDRSRFHLWSDIDLAVWGIPDDIYLRAYGAMIDFHPHFKIDLINPYDCSPLLREIIQKEGVEIK